MKERVCKMESCEGKKKRCICKDLVESCVCCSAVKEKEGGGGGGGLQIKR